LQHRFDRDLTDTKTFSELVALEAFAGELYDFACLTRR
jgi:hypothetical protein